MPCKIESERIEAAIAFHGHTCPGLAIGIRTAELAIDRLGIHPGSNVVCVTETDMCAVDGIQFLTGCTFGKGNLVHRDYGKPGFTFFDRDAGKGFRAVFLDEAVGDVPPEAGESPKQARTRAVMDAELGDLFRVSDISDPPVKPARILNSMVCESCSEKVMESRIRRFDGRDLCIPCFRSREQKV